MEYFPPALEALVEQFARLPGIGRKTAQRLAFFVLSLPEEEVEAFAQSVRNAKHTIALCPVCQNLTEGDGLCPICASDKRDGSVICVVADPKDVIAMERAREYNGRYHVLHGVLSPMNGVGPDDLHIKSLLDRVAQGEVREVIMATNPDTEGEATAMYLSRLLKPFGVKVTRLAYGVPVGGHLEYADDATLMRALDGRREIYRDAPDPPRRGRRPLRPASSLPILRTPPRRGRRPLRPASSLPILLQKGVRPCKNKTNFSPALPIRPSPWRQKKELFIETAPATWSRVLPISSVSPNECLKTNMSLRS